METQRENKTIETTYLNNIKNEKTMKDKLTKMEARTNMNNVLNV